MLIYALLLVSYVIPFLIFLDYHKRHNPHWAILYILVFFLFWIFGVRYIIARSIETGLIIAGSVPLLMVIYLLIAKKRKGTAIKKKHPTTVIDDF